MTVDQSVNPVSKDRYPEIDFLRAIAAYMVVWFHTAHAFVRFQPEITRHGTFLHDLSWIPDWGRTGVVTFFIISGFVIPSSLKGPVPSALRVYIIRRFFRLYPLFWLVTVLAFAVFRWAWHASFNTSILMANLTMIPSLLGSSHILGQCWTLEVELVFYGLCAVAYALGILTNPIWAYSIIVLAGIHGLQISELYGEPSWLYTLGFMHWGILFRRWVENGRTANLSFLGLTVSAGYLLLPACIWLQNGIRHANEFGIQKGIGYIAGLSLFFFVVGRYRFHSAVTTYLGSISYSVYLIHNVIHALVQHWLLLETTPASFRQQPLLAYMVANFLLTTLAAALLYRCIERPFINLAHKLTVRK